MTFVIPHINTPRLWISVNQYTKQIITTRINLNPPNTKRPRFIIFSHIFRSRLTNSYMTKLSSLYYSFWTHLLMKDEQKTWEKAELSLQRCGPPLTHAVSAPCLLRGGLVFSFCEFFGAWQPPAGLECGASDGHQHTNKTRIRLYLLH